jgi:lipopolysaccharide assembly protein A
MRLIRALLLLLSVAAGVLFGALNREAVRIELGFHTIENATLGITVLLALLAGALLAGLVLTVGVIWPLRHRLRRTGQAEAAAAPVAHE